MTTSWSAVELPALLMLPMSRVLGNTIFPKQIPTTDDECEEVVRRTLSTIYHPVGTCAMLPRDDDGVVDSNLVVYVTRNLRVVDASIIPLLISGNIQWTIYAIAERAADMIKASNSK
jgi:choline dehydrogenase